MHRFFIFNEQQKPKEKIIPTNEILNQAKKVLRIKNNEEFICIYNNLELTCKLRNNEFLVKNWEKFSLNKEYKIRLIQGIPTNKKMSLILQKATELNADEIILWQAKRSTSKIVDFEKKKDRLEKILIESCEQTRRNDIPKIEFINDVIQINEFDGQTIVFYEKEINNNFKKVFSKKEKTINVVIGPEGGIEENEIKILLNGKAKISKFWNNILRTETAAIAALSIINYEVNNE